ncbi:sigma-E factor negative regulatory protein [Aquabacterium sp.]|uniref:sigma-E factor negative regulatory protein n=1 Tax=Aquabacterium sp. TaxID=1872578 RepID=UPI002D800BC1|nr:sigma-E factor negative regulatory protein [Aquabacterium sp.]
MRQTLSSLMDGHTDAGQLEGACGAWRSDPKARECWHTYHLIGDVLRSEELAGAPARDAAFLSALRSRLAQEPVPLASVPAAPQPTGSTWWRGRLMAPIAVAAGFVAVAGVLVVTRVAVPEATGGVPVATGTGQPDVTVVNGQLIRDARLDRYLSAHRQVSTGASVHVPGTVVRSVDTIVLEHK